MSNLPVPWEGNQSSRQIAQAAKAQRRTELAVFDYHLKARYQAECERIDAQALSDVVRTALEEEIANLDFGLELAAGSPAKAELVARKIALQARINSARINRRFGA
jgi:hypothetical protein